MRLPSILLAALPVSILAQSCSIFTLTSTKYGYTRPADRITRVSPGVSCPAAPNITCGPLDGIGYVAVHNFQNVTLSSDERDILGGVIESSVNTSTVVGWVDGVSYTLAPGQAGYVGFTAELRCWAGLLGDCASGANEKNGTHVEACAPGILWDTGMNGSYYNLDGIFSFIATDMQTVRNMTSNPALDPPVSGVGRVAIRWEPVVAGAAAWLWL